jgi:twitching motility protein PilT
VKTPDKLLRHLERRDVTELALISGRLPCVKIGSSFDPVDDEAPTPDDILALLMTVGGSRYVDTLGPVPKQWTSRLGGVGIVAISAVVPRDGDVQARFSVAARDERARPATLPRRPPSDRAPAMKDGRDARDGRKSKPPPAPFGAPSRPVRTPSFGVPLKHDSLPPPAPNSAIDKQPRRAGTPPLAFPPPARVPTPAPGVADPPRDRGAQAQAAGAPLWEFPKRPRPSAADHSVRPSSPGMARVGRSGTKPMGDVTPVSPRPADAKAAADALRELESHLRTARSAHATDLHVISGRPLLLRVAGDLKGKGDPLPPRDVERMLMGCLPERLVGTFEELGSCDFSLDMGPLGRFRVNVGRQQGGYKGTIRVIPREVPTLEMLGLPSAIGPATKHHQGLIIVTGPTGHGKTSTLAAIVDILNQGTTAHIITVEDPVEYVHPKKKALISQREVGTHTQSFANALKGSLREDPDVIVVGELRDTETVRMAVSAAETGHLVIGTMNTPSASKTIDRLIDLFPPADQPQVRISLASGLRLIVGQRLVPSVDHSRLHAAAELLPGSVPLSALIREGKTFQIPSLQQRSKALGIIRLDDSLAALVQARLVALDVAKSYAEAPAELDALIASRGNAGAAGMRGKA